MWIDPFSRRLLKGAGLIPVSEGRGPVVLMYHSIEPEEHEPNDTWSVSAKTFREHMQLLKSEGWHTARICDLLQPESLPLRTVVISFDDGYANNFENGFEVLHEYGMTATWFIVTQDIGRHSRWLGQDQPFRPMLNNEQLRQMVDAGIEIGSHTRRHFRLSQLDFNSIWEEVSGSKKELEDILGLPVISFAYPYGELNDDYVAAVKKAGYRIACSTRTGWFGSDPDLLLVRRIAIFSHDNLSTFARKLAFADNNVEWGRMAKYAVGRVRSRLFDKRFLGSND
jgi:peptidoglycan/xylan/chitin deacetylase (PgdA/CDA1 family)